MERIDPARRRARPAGRGRLPGAVALERRAGTRRHPPQEVAAAPSSRELESRRPTGKSPRSMPRHAHRQRRTASSRAGGRVALRLRRAARRARADLLPSRTASARSASSRSRTGMELLSPPTATERTSKRRRSGCPASAASLADERRGQVPHDAPRADAHRAARARTFRPRASRDARSGGHARRRPHPDRRRSKIARSTGPIHGLAMDLGHHDGRPPADQSRDRRAGRRRIVREPAALRRIGRHVAHPLRHRASAASC